MGQVPVIPQFVWLRCFARASIIFRPRSLHPLDQAAQGRASRSGRGLYPFSPAGAYQHYSIPAPRLATLKQGFPIRLFCSHILF